MDAARDIETLSNRFLVIRINAFTKTIEDGYVRSGKTRVSDLMKPAEVAAYIANNIDVRVDPLFV